MWLLSLSALGMFIGHYLAWVCAGIMGAGAALLLKSSVTQLDAGAVAYEALGMAGILAVIIAGWTTSNPTIYRAGLAFHSLNPKWDRVKVTVVTGIVTTVVACFPFVFSKLMDFVGLMGLLLAPVGAVIVTEHWIFPKLGFTRYWSHFKNQNTNLPAVFAWLISLAAAFFMNKIGLHLFFLLLPTWFIATFLYIGLASVMGAKQKFEEADKFDQQEQDRKRSEAEFLGNLRDQANETKKQSKGGIFGLIAILALLACGALAIWVFLGGSFAIFKQWLWVPTLVYFVSAVLWATKNESETN